MHRRRASAEQVRSGVHVPPHGAGFDPGLLELFSCTLFIFACTPTHSAGRTHRSGRRARPGQARSRVHVPPHGSSSYCPVRFYLCMYTDTPPPPSRPRVHVPPHGASSYCPVRFYSCMYTDAPPPPSRPRVHVPPHGAGFDPGLLSVLACAHADTEARAAAVVASSNSHRHGHHIGTR